MPSVTEATRLRPLIGDHPAARLRARGIETVGDLLAWLPRRYVDYESDLSAAREGEHLVAVADVTAVEIFPRDRRRKAVGRNAIMRVTISDGGTSMPVTFFGTYGRERTLMPGVRAVWTGKVTTFNGRLQLTSPDVEIVAEQRADDEPGLLPLYTHVDRLRNSSVIIAVRVVLDQIESLNDPVPVEVRERHGLMTRLQAFRVVHRPRSRADIAAAMDRLRFEEAFVLQVALARRRADQARDRTISRRPVADGVLAAFDARLPFELTNGQQEVAALLASEMARETPMHRLLQGEVGSGKTVVALRAMLAAVDAGGQAALLAPTEVLAQQHHRSITALMGDLADGGLLSFEDGVGAGPDVGTRVVLLTGSLGSAARRRALSDIATGSAGIVVGTHALIQEGVEFDDLALVVVDEQHRFGVEQRDALRAKGAHPPHVLVMTATPIPRTVAMTVFGDMETSTLRELPAGRVPITSHVVEASKPAWVERTWMRLAEEVRAGRQAYVVCPRIGDPDERAGAPADEVDGGGDWAVEDSDGSGPVDDAASASASVYAVHTLLVEHPALAGVRIAMLHGRMTPEEKDRAMRDFASGEVDVLVATTVIEVGVDVANATVMVVMDADRFGISQLHQLRGRVGRGSEPGLCLLMTATDAEPALDRLHAVAASTDGFELARLDLRQRREGDVLGAAQSGGRSSLSFLGVIDDEDIIVAAREDAVRLVEADPELAAHPHLSSAVQRLADEDKAAFLERG
ncbi:DEAD/DEAH box helicase [Nostocoides sp. F2B08]|nr:ATP-dependent DNA helicase RecG [Tetrasphaera sp. F2B08]KAB7746587.1 DEAD/DEAH box helicase [Tetrasphaera sp. F2B08]